MWVAHEPSKCKSKSSTVSQTEATRDNSTSTGTAMASIINAYEDSQEWLQGPIYSSLNLLFTWALQTILVYLSHMMTTTTNYICTMISNISFTPSPNHQRKSSVQRIKYHPHFYFTRGPIGCPKQAYRCRHLAMLRKALDFCQEFTATKRYYQLKTFLIRLSRN